MLQRPSLCFARPSNVTSSIIVTHRFFFLLAGNSVQTLGQSNMTTIPFIFFFLFLWTISFSAVIFGARKEFSGITFGKVCLKMSTHTFRFIVHIYSLRNLHNSYFRQRVKDFAPAVIERGSRG